VLAPHPTVEYGYFILIRQLVSLQWLIFSYLVFSYLTLTLSAKFNFLVLMRAGVWFQVHKSESSYLLRVHVVCAWFLWKL